MNHTLVTEVIIRIIITIIIHITTIIHTIRTTHMAIMVDIDELIKGHDIVSTRGDFSPFLRREGPISGLFFTLAVLEI
jgi:Na+/melibiose symporter-like transporter